MRVVIATILSQAQLRAPRAKPEVRPLPRDHAAPEPRGRGDRRGDRLNATDRVPPAQDRPLSIFIRFLKFGLLAWGGPAAQIAMISKECVEEERWVSEETFKKTLAVYQVLPGPEAHELCVFFGRLRGGRLGGFLAGLGFMLPGFLLMLGLSVLYVEAGLNERFEDLFYGLRAAVGALTAMAVVRLGRKFIDDLPLAIIAIAVFALTLGVSLSFIVVLAGAGAVYWIWSSATSPESPVACFTPVLPAALLAALAGATLTLTAEIFLEGLKAGLLTFGGAYTVIPFLQESAVEGQHWLTEAEFLDGIALGGVLPAPLIIFSTFVGYLAGGLGGSLAMTLGIFLPAFVFPIFLHRQLVGIAESPRIRPFLLGVAAGVIGLIAAVTIAILRVSVTDLPTAILAIAAFGALYRFQGKLTVLFVVFGCGLIGALLKLAGA
ncbi:MAG: chromate efflux transporter [Thermoleophilaceae bacterium]|nr:chromate efflux transporter [Thermoleophilaceae bacterium]